MESTPCSYQERALPLSYVGLFRIFVLFDRFTTWKLALQSIAPSHVAAEKGEKVAGVGFEPT